MRERFVRRPLDSESFRDFVIDEIGHGMHISTCARVARAVRNLVGDQSCGKLVNKLAKAGERQPSHTERDFHRCMHRFAPDFGLRPYRIPVALQYEEMWGARVKDGAESYITPKGREDNCALRVAARRGLGWRAALLLGSFARGRR